ncbi:hypothetical protein GCM10017784_18270 [Deinococcus indicus]|nr:hypothetical protein GCM10017784_18270 [Deinococcus indicus]
MWAEGTDQTIPAGGVSVHGRPEVRSAYCAAVSARGAGPWGIIRTPIEWALQPVQSERMRLAELPRREGEKRVPDVEPAIR